MIPTSLQRHIERVVSAHRGKAVSITAVIPATGGSISQTAVLNFTDDTSVFLKWNPKAPQGMFVREAEGLRALRAACPLRIPEPLGYGEGDAKRPPYLIMENLHEPNPNSKRLSISLTFDEELGRGLAQQHRTHSDYYGFTHDNFIGPTPQPNPKSSSWSEFFRDQRLLHMISHLRARNRMQVSEEKKFSSVINRLPELFAPAETEPPSLLHGDLWEGNVVRDCYGRPGLVDPACYFGHREADLAMTELFGGFSAEFRASYEEAYPLLPGYAERRDIYNLYHILNHALLFGSGYMNRALEIAARY